MKLLRGEITKMLFKQNFKNLHIQFALLSKRLIKAKGFQFSLESVNLRF